MTAELIFFLEIEKHSVQVACANASISVLLYGLAFNYTVNAQTPRIHS